MEGPFQGKRKRKMKNNKFLYTAKKKMKEGRFDILDGETYEYFLRQVLLIKLLYTIDT